MSTSPKPHGVKKPSVSVSNDNLYLANQRVRSIPTLNEIANDGIWLVKSRHVVAAQLAVQGLTRLVEAEKELVEVKTKVQQLQHENKNLVEQAKLTVKEANGFKENCKAELTKRHAKLVDEINEQRQRIINLDAETESQSKVNQELRDKLAATEAVVADLDGKLTETSFHIEKAERNAAELRRTIHDKATKLRTAEQALTVANAEALAYKDKLEELYEILAKALGKNEVPSVLENARFGGCDSGAAADWHDDVDALKHVSGYEEFHSDRIPSGVSG